MDELLKEPLRQNRAKGAELLGWQMPGNTERTSTAPVDSPDL
jgi:hypothetical protein